MFASPLISILVGYFLPLITFFTFSYMTLPLNMLWGPFSLSLFIAFCGSLFLFILFKKKNLPLKPALQSPYPEIKEESKEDFLKKSFLENEVKELLELKASLENQLDKKEIHIHELKSELTDLKYEIKTLLDVNREETSSLAKETCFTEEKEDSFLELNSEVSTECQADLHLTHCLNLAKKITGAQLLSHSHSLFRDFPSESYALDLRRLFDVYQSETYASILVYSMKEGRLVFINRTFEDLSGWNKEKLIQDFEDLIVEGKENLRKSILDLLEKNETKTMVLFQNKSGEKLPLYFHLGLISSGIFKNNVIIIAYTPKTLDLLHN